MCSLLLDLPLSLIRSSLILRIIKLHHIASLKVFSDIRRDHPVIMSANGSGNNAATSLAHDYALDRDTPSQKVLYTTSNGVPMPHPYETQRAGASGPLLLQDFHLIDLLSHFDRERIPERVVHAKGSGAHGVFTCTDPLDDLTQADFLSTKGKQCPVTVRFSTVGGESGSHDLARDPRGFSVK